MSASVPDGVPPGIRIRRVTATDAVSLGEQMAAVLREDPDTRNWIPAPATWDPVASHMAVCDSGEIAGAVAVWRSGIHPYRRYMTLWVDPLLRRRGIGSALWARAYGTGGLPWQTSVWDSQTALVRFLRRNGFTVFRRTYRPTLSLSAMDPDRGPVRYSCGDGDAAARCGHAGLVLRSLAEVEDTDLRSKWIGAAVSAYSETHADHPPAMLDAEAWGAILSRGLLKAGSLVSLQRDRIAGLALLYEGEEPVTAEIGWCVARTAREAQGSAGHWATGTLTALDRCLLQAMACRLVRYARDRGYERLRIEADTTDRWNLAILEMLPFGPAPTWLSLLCPASSDAG